MPFNVLDQSMKKEGIFSKLKSMNIEIHARSIFMQGALLFNKGERPDFFKKWDKKFNAWDKIVEQSNASRLELALKYVYSESNIDYCILGVDNASQLKQLVEIGQKKMHLPNVSHLSVNDEELLNPLYWKI